MSKGLDEVDQVEPEVVGKCQLWSKKVVGELREAVSKQAKPCEVSCFQQHRQPGGERARQVR